VNKEIDVDQVRLIDQDGEQVGVVSLQDGIARAEAVGLDLVEVAPEADPPVCKILDYGKHKFEAQKRRAEARKKQKTVDVRKSRCVRTSTRMITTSRCAMSFAS